MTDPVQAAAIPTARAILAAAGAFIDNLGDDPAQVAIKLPGAVQIFLGTLELQGPALAISEFGAAKAAAKAKLAAWDASLAAKTA